ncbi:MAG TPA: amidohydrolase, partial [Hyphomonas sp.]|nr:amidohydrolase [Hyphomonas sp.]
SPPPPPLSLPAIAAKPVIDDFEREDGRTALDTLAVTDLDFGAERSVIASARRPLPEGGHALSVSAQMARKTSPMAGIIFPLRRGSVAPTDVTGFDGVSLDLFGEGDYTLRILTLSGYWEASISAGKGWQALSAPFSAFKFAGNPESAPVWTGKDLLQVGVLASRPGGESAWFEIDNIGFYSAD